MYRNPGPLSNARDMRGLLVWFAQRQGGGRVLVFAEWCERANDLSLFFRHRHAPSAQQLSAILEMAVKQRA